jgi:hypothetical protein
MWRVSFPLPPLSQSAVTQHGGRLIFLTERWRICHRCSAGEEAFLLFSEFLVCQEPGVAEVTEFD